MNTNLNNTSCTTATNIASETNTPIAKVLGIGGGGGNAVNYIYQNGNVEGLSYLLFNTDTEALSNSPIPHKITPKSSGVESVAQAVSDCTEEIKQALTDGSILLFVIAGMGGNTGTEASPLISRIARESGRLTVGIATVPFRWEGKQKILHALEGIDALRQEVDALIIIDNERLKDAFGNMLLSQVFKLADDTLCNVVRGISDIISLTGTINLDLTDVATTLAGKGIAVVSTGLGKGHQRLQVAFEQALNSPLFNSNHISESTDILLAIYSSPEETLEIEELNTLDSFMANNKATFTSKWGYYIDDTLEPGQVRITILASGFDYDKTRQSIVSKIQE